MAKRQVKVIRVRHGFFGNANNRRLEKTITKWMQKGFKLDKQEDIRGGCARPGYTLLTLIHE